VRDAGRKAAEFCRAHGMDISEAALRFCLDHPYVASTLIGIAGTREVETSLNLLRSATGSEFVGRLEAVLAPVFNYDWPSGRPENQA